MTYQTQNARPTRVISHSKCLQLFSILFIYFLLAKLCSGMWDLSSLARAGTRAPCLGSAGSKPLDAREAPALNSGQTLSADFSYQSVAAKTRLLNKKPKIFTERL